MRKNIKRCVCYEYQKSGQNKAPVSLYSGVSNKNVGSRAGILSESKYKTSLNAELIIAAALIWNLINTCVNRLILYYFPIFLVTVCQHLFYVQSVGANLNTINLLQ